MHRLKTIRLKHIQTIICFTSYSCVDGIDYITVALNLVKLTTSVIAVITLINVLVLEHAGNYIKWAKRAQIFAIVVKKNASRRTRRLLPGFVGLTYE